MTTLTTYLEACPLRKSQFGSLNFVTNSTFGKVFDTGFQEVVDVCLELFNLHRRKSKFLKQFSNASNIVSQTFAAETEKERHHYVKFFYIKLLSALEGRKTRQKINYTYGLASMQG